MINLFEHQKVGVKFLVARRSAMLADCMGLGKTRQALIAALQLFTTKKIDRVLVLAPAAVRYSWMEELKKLSVEESTKFLWGVYDAKRTSIIVETNNVYMPVLVISYALLPQKRHAEALERWCEDGKALLICDESSFLKNRTAKQTKSSARIARSCAYRWLLTGTPVANSPLDLYAQAQVMSNGERGPLSAFKSFYHFQARYAILKQMTMGPNIRFKQVVGYQNLPELTKRFAPYVLRREKKDCLDLPDKSYIVREVQLSEATWRIYQELKREAMLALPDTEERPEPNAAVRILRLCQLTSGHVGFGMDYSPITDRFENNIQDISSEKLDYIAASIIDGELSQEHALIVWCRWRRERERLVQKCLDIPVGFHICEIFGGQNEAQRKMNIEDFMQKTDCRRVLFAQPHAGGFGLNLTAASTAIYLSNDFSYTTRVQSEDRIHRIGQSKPCLYVDIVATGPKGQRTVDHHVLEALRAKKDLAATTCAAWRCVLGKDNA